MHEFVEGLLKHPGLGSMVVHRRTVEGTSADFADPARPLPPRLQVALEAQGIRRLYRHQARGLDLAREDHNVVAVTPTASGKTLLFTLPVLESVLDEPRSKALFLYPTKALAQDQLGAFREFSGGLGALAPPRFEIYDGDTPSARRRKIKADPPQVLLTNPDMLHLGILSHHQDWERLFCDLRWVVLDELHVYRGVFGAHVHHILGRLRRVCALYGSEPRFIAASATVGNPGEFAQKLVGSPFHVVETSGAARAPLDVVFMNPAGVSPYTATVRLLAETTRAGLKSIAFTKARRVTELIYTWLVQQEPKLRDVVAPYRAGYLPEERRALEARLFRGDLSAIITTSALELGIDVGALDVCVLVGYPGSLISSWQRMGRVGRQGRHGLVILVAMPDALDQYVVHHPELFFGRVFEKAVLDPWNPLVAAKHLVCAAAEDPLRRDEIEAWGPSGHRVARDLVDAGGLVQDEPGTTWFSFRRKPHRDVSPRSAGQPFTIVSRGSSRRGGSADGGAERERLLGKIDGVRVYYECHPGAIYLHGGQSHLVLELDEDQRKVVAEAVQADYYTVVLGDKETEILERLDARSVGPFAVGLGRLKVTVRIREYQKRRLFGGEPISTHPLETPPLIFETIGFWIELPPGFPAAFTERGLHFMGGIHAVEHAVIGLFPLLAIADRGDIGGISYTGHPQIGAPAVFVYDGVPGGAGLAEQGFAGLEVMLCRTLELLETCACEDGCPGCIQSPKCGNGNKPLDKEAALLVLRCLVGQVTLESLSVTPAEPSEPKPLAAMRTSATPTPSEGPGKHGIRRAGNVVPATLAAAVPVPAIEVAPGPAIETLPIASPTSVLTAEADETVVVFDVETQRSAEDVGGWTHIDKMGLALAVVFDVRRQVYRTYLEADVHRLLLDLVMADRVVGFNIDRFDLPVLSAYTDQALARIRTLDLLGEIRKQLGFRISLNHLSEVNLGEAKSGDGLQSLRWWKEGRVDLIEQYCRKDVDITHRLFQLGRRQKYLLYRDHSDRRVRVPVHW